MKTEARELEHIDTSSVWAEEKPATKTLKKKAPGIKLLAVIATIAFIAAACVIGFMYQEGLKTCKALSTGTGDSAAAAQTLKQWMLKMGLAGIGCSAGLFVVALAGGQMLRRRWAKQHQAVAGELESHTSRLTGKLAELKVLQEEA